MLETPRLILRPWRDSDVEHWVAMCADARVMEFFPGIEDRSRAEAGASRVREALNRDGFGWWVLEIKGGAEFAGVIALQEIPFEAHFTPAIEVGWRLRYDQWGNGYATEGARAAIDYAFNKLGRGEVVAITAKINTRSQRVMQRLGMTHDPAEDFDHPRLEPDHRLYRHVLYRLRRR
jgi:RimJ/RimL family protein N-acetyltransferase